MTFDAVLKAAERGASRRLVESLVVFAVLAASSAAALVGGTLLGTSSQGFYAGCAVTNCANLAVTLNSSKVTAGELDRLRHLPGVTKTAGPYPETTITVTAGGGAVGTPGAPRGSSNLHSGAQGSNGAALGGAETACAAGASTPAGPNTGTAPGGLPPQTLTVVGRPSASGPLDDVVANPSIMDALTHGRSRWPTRPGDIALDITTEIRLPLGSNLTVTSAPGKPKLSITGYAEQQLSYEDAWVTPGEINALRPKGAPAHEQVLFTFSRARTATELKADLAEIRRALPAGVIASSQSWLGGLQLGSQQNVNTPFVLAFSVLALLLGILITANVVSAAVVASYRRNGVLKSVGFTPAQVAATYLIQVGIPAVGGVILGTLLGNVWVLPVIGNFAIQGQRVAVPLWMNTLVPLGMFALSGLTAAVPAVQAGRLSAVAAIAAGVAPQAGRGYAVHRVIARLSLPRPVTVGVAAPLSRPARSLAILVALAIGLVGTVLATSLDASLHKINHSAIQGLGDLDAGYQGGHNYTLTSVQNAALLAKLRSQPGILHFVAEDDLRTAIGPPGSELFRSSVTVGVARQPGLPVTVHAYDGDPAWLDWNLIRGHWYHGSHQVDVSANFLTATGHKIGDTIALTVNGTPVTARIAGEIFVPSPAPVLFTSWQALGDPAALAVNHYDIDLKPGLSPGKLIRTLTRTLGHGYHVYLPAGPSVAAQVDLSLFELLEALVVVLAGLGVLNAVLMATRQRVHELGVFKAIGMTPRQTLTMVLCWVFVPTAIAAAVALPVGLMLQDTLVRRLATTVGMVLPPSFVHVLGVGDLLLLVVGGFGIALAGAIGPAAWAATTKTTTALHTE